MLTDHLPDWMSTYVQQTADEMQVPVDAVALLSLGALSAAVNGGADSSPTHTWREPAALYVLALLASGEGKTPTFNRLMEPVKAAFAEVTGVSQSADPKYQTIRNEMNRDYVKQVKRKALGKVSKGEMTREEAIAAVAAAEREVALFHSTNIPLVALTDVTPAGLLDAMRDNDGRVVIASPEAEGILNFRGSSKEGILKGFDGDELSQSRRNMGNLTINRCVVTSMIAMQPAVLNSIGADMVNRGLMPRFLISYPESMVGARDSRPRLVTEDATADYEGEMTRIVRVYSERKDQPEQIFWNRDAVKELGTWRDELEPLLARGGWLGTIDAWGSKVRGAHFIRLAALLAIANNRDNVTVGDCAAAKGILRSLMIDAKRAFGEMGASFAEDDTVYLMGLIERVREARKAAGKDDQFSRREIKRGSNRFMADPARLDAAIEQAIEEGLIEVAGGRTGGQVWRVVEDGEDQ